MVRKMSLKRLLGRYNSEESGFLCRINQDDMHELHALEDRGGFRKSGEKMSSKYDFVPSDEEMSEYISKSLGRLLGNGK